MNIVVSDDDSITLARLSRYLLKQGHTVFSCCNGLCALENFESSNIQIDMLITDWMMPSMDGVTLARKIRQMTEDNAYVYIILLTSKSETEDMVSGFTNGGVDDYIVKPFSFDELHMRVNVGERVIRLEREHTKYSKSLEGVVHHQALLLQKTKDELIDRLLSALDFRDQETGAHVRRIGLTSLLLARRIGWTAVHEDDLRVAAAMHDIGKVGIPDGILLKDGKLTPAEFEVMKSHTLIGASILSGSGFAAIRTAHDIALCHHERIDGGGYPKGLSGEDIPISARIVSIADVFDALANDRVYRPAMGRDEVLRLMTEGRGKHFDPLILDAFLAALPDVWSIQEQNRT